MQLIDAARRMDRTKTMLFPLSSRCPVLAFVFVFFFLIKNEKKTVLMPWNPLPMEED